MESGYTDDDQGETLEADTETAAPDTEGEQGEESVGALIATENLQDTAAVEAKADEDLVEEAYKTIESIVVQHFTKTMEEVGEYLIKNFFDDDVERALSQNPTKKKSLGKLIAKLRSEGEGSPSRTWIYNSVKLVADKRYFEENHVKEYSKLKHSHKVYLTHVKDMETKKDLVIETVKKGYSVAQLKERIKEVNADGYVFPALSVLDQKKADIQEWSLDKLEQFATKTDEDIASLKAKLERYTSKRHEVQTIIEKRKGQQEE